MWMQVEMLKKIVLQNDVLNLCMSYLKKPVYAKIGEVSHPYSNLLNSDFSNINTICDYFMGKFESNILEKENSLDHLICLNLEEKINKKILESLKQKIE
jgi:hypothetical protein